MATRRNVASEKTALEKNDAHAPVSKSDITPAVPAHVIYKLLGFTLAMAVVPITSYFLTLNSIFGGNSTWAGATAALMANVVLIGYIIVAMKEDDSEPTKAAEKSRKDL
ncbi:vacuolar ATPase assembly integral membrane protein [Bisporella sp. PMI_857]|nr:vacuolar ATPase assembly integral membrane protein [Bisporella sp. PMI_857]